MDPRHEPQQKTHHELSLHIPNSPPGTLIHLHITLLAACVVLFVTTTSNASGVGGEENIGIGAAGGGGGTQGGAGSMMSPLGSFVLGLPDVSSKPKLLAFIPLTFFLFVPSRVRVPVHQVPALLFSALVSGFSSFSFYIFCRRGPMFFPTFPSPKGKEKQEKKFNERVFFCLSILLFFPKKGCYLFTLWSRWGSNHSAYIMRYGTL